MRYANGLRVAGLIAPAHPSPAKTGFCPMASLAVAFAKRPGIARRDAERQDPLQGRIVTMAFHKKKRRQWLKVGFVAGLVVCASGTVFAQSNPGGFFGPGGPGSSSIGSTNQLAGTSQLGNTSQTVPCLGSRQTLSAPPPLASPGSIAPTVPSFSFGSGASPRFGSGLNPNASMSPNVGVPGPRGPAMGVTPSGFNAVTGVNPTTGVNPSSGVNPPGAGVNPGNAIPGTAPQQGLALVPGTGSPFLSPSATSTNPSSGIPPLNPSLGTISSGSPC